MSKYTTMNPTFTTTDELKQFLETAIDDHRDKYDLTQMELMAEPIIAKIELDIDVRAKFEQYLLAKDGYTIEAHVAFKELGVVAEDADPAQSRRMLESGRVIDAGLKLGKMKLINISYSANLQNMNITVDDKYGPIYNNDFCIIVKQKGSCRKPTYKYMITKRAFQKVLYRSYNNDKFADYFALMMELYAIYKNYESSYNTKKLEQTVSSLEKKLEQFHKESMEVLQETKQAATEARDETIKTRKTLDDAMDSMDMMHVDFVETSYHSTAIVQDGKKTNFALTSIVDDNGTVRFKTWRTQKDRMFDVLLDALAFEGHELVIPPMYFAGATNVPIATANKLKMNLDTIAKIHNRTATGRKGKWSMTGLIKSTGLKLNSNPVWVPNPHISISDIVNTYLDVISDSQSRAFQLMDVPQDFEDTVKDRRTAYKKRVARATGDTKKYLEDMAKSIQDAYTTYTQK